MKKIWLVSSVLFQIFIVLFITFFSNRKENLGIDGASIFLLICLLLFITSITYHPRYKFYFEEKNILRTIDWFLKLLTFVLMMVYSLTDIPKTGVFIVYGLIVLCDVFVVYLLNKHISTVSKEQIDEYEKKYRSNLEQISIRKATFPLIILYGLVILILMVILEYSNDMVVGCLFICFSLVNMYGIKLNNRKQVLVWIENLLFLFGIIITLVIIKIFGSYEFNKNGIIELIGMIIIVISLTPFNNEVKKNLK